MHAALRVLSAALLVPTVVGSFRALGAPQDDMLGWCNRLLWDACEDKNPVDCIVGVQGRKVLRSAARSSG